MAINHRYPYTDIHDLNLDWILKKMKELEIEFDEFKVVNNITFSGTWDITKQYPAWTIVSDKNIGYVSLQPVPAGIPLSNGSYWVEVIDYTAQIAGLENRVIALEGDMITAQGDITSLQNDVSDLEDDMDSLMIDRRTFLFVGDSYASQTESWVTEAVNMAGIVNYTNEAVTGTGFHDGTFEDQLVNFAGDRSAVTDIVVGGGLNDSTFESAGADMTQLSTAIGSFATYAKTEYPNARLWLAFMGNACDDAPLLAGRTVNKRSWAKWVYVNVGRKNGFNIISGCDLILAQGVSNFKSDRLHPSAAGAECIGRVISNVLTCGQSFNVYPWYGAGISAYGNNTLVDGTLNYTIIGDYFAFDMSDGFYLYTGTDYASFTASDPMNLCVLSRVYFNKKFEVPVAGLLLKYGTKNYQNFYGVLEFYQDKIKLRLDTINSAGTGYETWAAMGVNSGIIITRGAQFVVPGNYIN